MRERRSLIEVRVIHDADGLVVVDKPPGLETTGRTPDDPGGLQHHLARQLGRKVWAVHQLDRDTSGVSLFVRRRRLVAEWQARLTASSTRKRYLALVHGVPSFERRTLEAPLAYDRAARRWRVHDARGKPARTSLRVLGRGPSAALLEAVLHTGRTHQARVHLAYLGHPLIGERRYREPPSDAHPRHALHAHRLELSGLAFEVALPEDLTARARMLGIEADVIGER